MAHKKRHARDFFASSFKILNDPVRAIATWLPLRQATNAIRDTDAF